MPVRVVIDTTRASAVEIAAFNAAMGATVNTPALGAGSQAFTFEHSASTTGRISASDVYRETMATIRYYGSVRYIFLPVYLTAMGVLASRYYDKSASMPPALIIATGLLISFVLMAFEASISNNLRRLWREIEHMIGDQRVFPAAAGVDPLAHRHGRIQLWILRLLLGLPYLAGLLFWSLLAARLFHITHGG